MGIGGDGLLFGVLSTWLTPTWLLGVGAALGLVVLVLLYGGVRLVSAEATAFVHDSFRAGFLRPVLLLALILAVLAAFSSLVVPIRDLARSLVRLPSAGVLDRMAAITADAADQQVDLEMRPSELKTLTITSDQDLTIHLVQYGIIKEAREGKIVVAAGEPWSWSRAESENNLFYGDTAVMSIKNLSGKPASLHFAGTLTEEFPEVASVPKTAGALVALVLLFLLFKLLCPKIAAIALATSREVTAQPLFQVVMALGIFAIIVFVFIPYNTFGEDVKTLKSSDFELIRVLAIIVALWSASESVSGEIEGRTAMTVLSKPVGRRQFLLGKFFGILLPLALLFLFLGAVFLYSVSFKVVYDAREGAQLEPNWQACFEPMISSVPGLVLAFFEVVTLTAVSVALSTRLPLLANLIVCCSIYVLGHLVPMLTLSRLDDHYGIIRFVGQLFAAVLPVLDHFDIEAAVSTGTHVPVEYLAWAFVYCALYSTVAMLLALALFEDRDLA